MNKKQKIKYILQELFEHTKKTSHFSKYEIERAIRVTLYLTDNRPIQNWYDLLWSLELFVQPTQGCFDMNWERVVELEIALPLELDPNQRRLSNV